jgi:hypothetical protein
VAQLRSTPVADDGGIPARLFSTLVADWVGPDEVPPDDWPQDKAWMWPRVTAYRRRWQARIEWARQHGRPASWSVKP